jgi:hypothetical protein
MNPNQICNIIAWVFMLASFANGFFVKNPTPKQRAVGLMLNAFGLGIFVATLIHKYYTP